MAGNKKPVVGLNDQERFPLIADLSLLMKMRQDEFAPAFNFKSGDRLTASHLAKVHQYASEIRGSQRFWEKGKKPQWIDAYVGWCKRTVPYYRQRPDSFEAQPTISRGDIGMRPWEFVSDQSPIDDLLVYQTSGSTGEAMNVLFDPVAQACWLPQLESILDRYAIRIDGGPDKVALAMICSQTSTLTFASLSTYLQGAGILKINLHPNDWKDPQHRKNYLEKYNPQVLTGDPFSFLDLLKLQPKIRPKVLVSSAMKLTSSVKQKLEEYFQCPALDIYSMTECRMIAVAEHNKFRAIRPDLYLEIFDKDQDVLLPPGERGELVVTGGNNPFLPLVRYRTGDFCKLELIDTIPYLVDLEARSPVVFYTRSGKMVNNIDISQAMSNYPIVGFTLHQAKDFHLTFKGWSVHGVHSAVKASLEGIFGKDISVAVEIEKPGNHRSNKTVTYTSDF